MFAKLLSALGSESKSKDATKKHKDDRSKGKLSKKESLTRTEQTSEDLVEVIPPAEQYCSNDETKLMNTTRSGATQDVPAPYKDAGRSLDTIRDVRSSFANESQGVRGGVAHASAGGVPRNMPSSSSAFNSQIPEELLQPYLKLAIVPQDMPVPLVMLQKLWELPGLAEVEQVAQALKKVEVLRIAVLEDDSIWCLVSADHLEVIGAKVDSMRLRHFHEALLDSYTAGGQKPLYLVPDDGYIVQNMSHHLEGARRTEDIKKLLTEPLWIENKLHAYGTAAVVQDFRRYISLHGTDGHVKLLLQAFQLSLGCCMEPPAVHMLKEQMLARMMAVASHGTAVRKDTRLSICAGVEEWYTTQRKSLAVDGHGESSLVHLMPRTISLEQAGGLHRMTLRGHTGPIHKVLISPNCHDVITISQDGSAQVWDMNIGDSVMKLTRGSPLTDAAVAPGGKIVVVASEDGRCCVWDLANGQVSHELKGHGAKVNATAIDSQGLRCITASDDHSLRVWSILSGHCEMVLCGASEEGAVDQMGYVINVAISSDGTLAAAVSDDFTCRVWDLDLGGEKCMHVMTGHSGWVVSVHFIGNTADIVTASHDHTARIWDGKKGRCLSTLEGHTGRVNKVVLDSGGVYAVTCSDDKTARVWDLDEATCIQVLRGHRAWVNDAAITREGTHVITVSGDHVCALWNVKTGQIENLLEGHSDNVRGVTLTYRGRFAVTASDDCTARVWDTAAPALTSIERHTGKVTSLVALPSWEQVVSVGEDGYICVWDCSTCRLTHRMAAHASSINYLSAHMTENLVVTGSGDRHVCVWNTSTGLMEMSLPAQQGSRVKSMACDRTLEVAAVLLFDGTASMWDLKTGKCNGHLIKRGKQGKPAHAGGVNGIYLSKNGQQAVTTAKDCTACIWDLKKGSVSAVVKGHGDSVICAAINPDEVLVATSSLDTSIRVSTMLDGENVAVLPQPKNASANQIVFSPDGVFLAAVLDDDAGVVWDLLCTEARAPIMLDGHKSEVNGICFSPVSYWRHGAILATWSQDCTVRVWRLSRRSNSGAPRAATCRQLAMFMGDGAITSCCFAGSQSDMLVIGDATGAVHFLDLPLELQCQQ